MREKGANACPPLVVGVGIGSTFDKVAGLAKRALMRPVDEPAADDRLRALEEELLAAVNATGIGPGGLGGRTTALAVRVATAPCHIAALPLAINMGCSAMRRITVPLACQPSERLDAAASRRTRSSRDAAGLRTEVRGACAIPRISGTAETLADFAEPASDRSRCARSAADAGEEVRHG